MTTDKIVAFTALLPLLLAWLYHWRFRKFTHLPQLPKNLFFGHIITISKHLAKGYSSRHTDYVIYDMVEEAGHPQIMGLDVRPVNYCLAVITSHRVAEQISRSSKLFPYSVTKSPTLDGAFRRLIGAHSIISADGESWRTLRKRFNPGFAPSHLLTLLPQILSKVQTFTTLLDPLAESSEPFNMDPLCTNLTFDIIGTIVMNLDFKAQEHAMDPGRTHPVVKDYKTLIRTFEDTGKIWLWANIPKRIKRILWDWRSDKSIKKAIVEKFEEMKPPQTSSESASENSNGHKPSETRSKRGPEDRSILALAFKDIDTLTPETLQSTADQVKTFLFAGHDTTSILLQRLFYALSICPRALAAIRAEHSAVIGTQDPVEAFLQRPDEILKRLTYTSACIKEALRLWPPAGSARMTHPGTGFHVRLDDGQEVCLDGTLIYLCHYVIQRDKSVYGDNANDFVPERWLGDVGTSADEQNHETEAGHDVDGKQEIPISAWRPFERGPRNCIGQEVANLEARVILACVLRRYDFWKVGAGEPVLDDRKMPVVDERTGSYKLKSELLNTAKVTAKPSDLWMKIRLHRPGEVWNGE